MLSSRHFSAEQFMIPSCFSLTCSGTPYSGSWVGIVLSYFVTTALNSLLTKGAVAFDDFGSYSIAPQITEHWDWVIVGTLIFASVAFIAWRANRIRHPQGGP